MDQFLTVITEMFEGPSFWAEIGFFIIPPAIVGVFAVLIVWSVENVVRLIGKCLKAKCGCKHKH